MGGENSKLSKNGVSPRSSIVNAAATVNNNNNTKDFVGDDLLELNGNNMGGLPPTIRVGGSASGADNLLKSPAADHKLSIDALSSRSRSGSASSTTNVKALTQISVKKPAMSLKNRQLVQGCFQNPHENLGRRILKRTAEKRRDFGKFYMGLGGEQKDEIEETIKAFLKNCVSNVDSIDEVQKLATEFGGRFVQYRLVSFKADYFSSIADSTITECAFLDNAVHPAHQTLSAFSQFITMLFSAVRDGFYQEMRKNRRTSNSFSTGSNGPALRYKKPGTPGGTLDTGSQNASREASPRRSISPADESSSQNSQSNGGGTLGSNLNINESHSQPSSRKTSLTTTTTTAIMQRKSSLPRKASLTTQCAIDNARTMRKASSTDMPYPSSVSPQNTSSACSINGDSLKPPTS